MGALTVSSVVLVKFPFSDLSQSKLRPAVVLADAGRGDWILCQITSNPYSDPNAVKLDDNDFSSGGLRVTSYARGGKLFTANADIMADQMGNLKEDIFQHIVESIVALLQSSIK